MLSQYRKLLLFRTILLQTDTINFNFGTQMIFHLSGPFEINVAVYWCQLGIAQAYCRNRYSFSWCHPLPKKEYRIVCWMICTVFDAHSLAIALQTYIDKTELLIIKLNKILSLIIRNIVKIARLIRSPERRWCHLFSAGYFTFRPLFANGRHLVDTRCKRSHTN